MDQYVNYFDYYDQQDEVKMIIIIFNMVRNLNKEYNIVLI